jgi:type III restriction enzyme
MELKLYQDATLGVLRRFFEEARIHGPASAYAAITSEPEQARRLRGYGGKYEPILGLAELPYVCLRLPTGGGKTLLAAHSINVAKTAWIEKDFPLVLWLVPSNMIRSQTVDALNNPRHPYRKALDSAFDGRVRVFDMGDFTRLRPQDLKANLCVVVGTIQTLRVDNTEGRKVYAHHEELETHFAGVPSRSPGLETLGAVEAAKVGGHADDIRFSFANLLHLHRPLMIVDEAHKAVTGLSRDMQARVNPCAIIEFTATPQKHSNILHAVSAAELKDAEMIKLPLQLAEHESWESAVTGAVAKRAELEAEAEKDREAYIRPIVLFQAEDKNREVTAAALRQHLIDVHDIDEKRIAVATGNQTELDGINLFDPDCPIDFVITVEALKEGWDCSFAYVFCSVANIKSSTDAEQLLGRVLRMPYAKRRASKVLNKAYANLVSKSFAEAANTLRDRLVDMGFEEREAEANIEPAQPGMGDGLWGERRRPSPSTRVTIIADTTAVAAIRAAAPERVTVEAGANGATVIAVTGFLRAAEKEAILAALPAPAAGIFRDEIARFEAEHLHTVSPAELGKTFVAPRLMAWVQGSLEFADSELLAEYFDWSLLDHSAQLDARDFSVIETAETFEIDLDGDSLMLRHSDQSDQLLLDVPVEGWTPEGLVRILDKMVRDKFVSQGELVRWLGDVVQHLTTTRRIPLATLMRCRFILARKLKDKIAAIRQTERERAFQTCLFAVDAKPEISFENGFSFFEGMYDGVLTYRGKYAFSRHFLGSDRVPAFDGKEDGEEFKCAQILDSMSEVEFWVRNVAQHPNSFWLPVAKGRTYPDFVAQLKDGRLLVIEYKGEHLVADSSEKRNIGTLWQEASKGKCVYIMAEKQRAGIDVKGQIRTCIS